MRPANISAGQAKEYYYQKDPFHGEQALKLHGAGAVRLGIAGTLPREQFERLLEGKDPSGKDKWEVKGAGPDRERAGIDIPLTAPKSVSIQAYHSTDPAMRQDIQDALRAASEKFAAYKEKQGYFQYRETNNGITEIKTGQGLYSFFQHSESRALDPHGHVHMVSYNAVVTSKGEVRALCGDKIFAEQRHLTVVHHSFLAKELTDRGYALESRANGTFELAGHNPKQVEQFSKRGSTIDEKLKDLQARFPNATAGQLQELAQKSSRDRKDRSHTAENSEKSWTAQDKLNGIEQRGTDQSIRQTSALAKDRDQAEGADLSPKEYIGKAVEALTARESTFTRAEVVSTAAVFAMGKYDPEQLQKVFDETVKGRDVKLLGTEEQRHGHVTQKVEVYSSKEMIQIEKDILRTAREGQGKAEPIMGREEAQKALGEWEAKQGIILTADQRQAAAHILTSADKVLLVQGDSGTGKTTLLKAVNEIVQERGYQTAGLAATGKAATQIEQSSGIESQTAARFILKGDEGTSGKSLTVLDETSMLGSKDTFAVLQRTVKDSSPFSRTVMIADVKQIPSIAAGKAHADLQEWSGLPVPHLKENVRQTTAEAKEIANALSEKNYDKAFTKLQEQGRIIEISDRGERHAALANAYVKDVVAGKDTILTTATNADRADLNQQIHVGLQEARAIGQENYTLLVRESKNLGEVEKQFAGSYTRGDVLIANRRGLATPENPTDRSTLSRGTELQVAGIDYRTHQLTAVDLHGARWTVNLQEAGSKFAVYFEKAITFSEGEKIIFNKNDKGTHGIGVSNGERATIQNINTDTGRIIVEHETGKLISFNLSNYNYFSPGYAVTKEKSQGMTVKNEGRVNVDTERGTSANATYVEVTRAKEGTVVYVDNIENFKEQMRVEIVKTSTLDERKIEHEGDKKAEEKGTEKTQSEVMKDREGSTEGIERGGREIERE